MEQNTPKAAAWLLASCAFLTGAAVMVIELGGARLIAPLCGNTMPSWTALIGIILGAMALGSYLGGKVIDAKPTTLIPGILMAGGGIATCLMPTISEAIASSTTLASKLGPENILAGPLILSTALFTIPALLLGACGPCWVKLINHSSDRIGRSAGIISMTGTLGSFTGTFASGFWLLSTYDVRTILVVTGIFLFLLSLIFWIKIIPQKKPATALVAIGLTAAVISIHPILCPLKSQFLYVKSTPYHTIKVLETPIEAKLARVIILDAGMDGGIHPEDGTTVFPYQHYWELPSHNPDFRPEHMVFIGAGAFGMPINASKQWPDSKIDVVEIDPEVIHVGKMFFGFQETAKMKAFATDGRMYLKQLPPKSCDLIFGDAYNGQFRLPAHLATNEFFELTASRLKPGGMFMMNILGQLEPPSNQLAAGIFASLKTQFAHVRVISVQPENVGNFQNLIVVASQTNLDWLTGTFGLPGKLMTEEASENLAKNVTTFSDYCNPIDTILAKNLMSQHFKVQYTRQTRE